MSYGRSVTYVFGLYTAVFGGAKPAKRKTTSTL